MDPHAKLDVLLAADVLAATDDDRLRVTDDFGAEVAAHREDLASLATDERVAAVAGSLADAEAAGALRRVGGEDVEFLATVLALDDRLEATIDAEWLQAGALLEQFQGASPQTAGVPDAFVPAAGDRLPVLMAAFSPAIVYVWREDCDPCDLMREEFDDLFETPPEGLALFAVYGPDYVDALAEYDVEGAPTTLFVLDGQIDTRLIGGQHREVLEQEVAKLREYARNPA